MKTNCTNSYTPHRSNNLIISSSSNLTFPEIKRLVSQNVTILNEERKPYCNVQLIDQSVRELQDAFRIAKAFRRLPLKSLRDQIIPIIIQICHIHEIGHIYATMAKRDAYTYTHCVGVTMITRIIGICQGLSEEELKELTICAFLHDIGKIKVPLEVLHKSGKLSSMEFEEMKKHSKYGYDLLRRIPGISERTALVALQHHEREDGSGYPSGIKGDRIETFSKIVAIADVFHAMISKRSYKASIPLFEVLRVMSEDAHDKFDSTLSVHFFQIVMEWLIGNRVLLTNGTVGEIMDIHSYDPIHPVIEVNGKPIDLSRKTELDIEAIL
ncbi:HD-GYP domain-containing protein [Marinicrinis lubricantis]